MGTYTADTEMIPDMKNQGQRSSKDRRQDHHTLEWCEDRGGQEPKATEINYNAQEIWRAIPDGTAVEIRP